VLEAQGVSRQQCPLVGMGCLLLAAKYEEVDGEFLAEHLSLGVHTITPEVLQAIHNILMWVLRTLHYQVATPTVYHFLGHYLRASAVDNDAVIAMVQLACFLSEWVLHEFDMLRFLPSVTAATIVRTCRKTFQMQPFWSPALAMCTQYEEMALEECATVLRGIVATPLHPESVVFKKYSRPKCHEVALLVVIV
jgi:hypothetical protein